MVCWPCVSIYLYNKNQLDALFILSLFHQSPFTCFRHSCSSSSGGMLYIYNNWYISCFSVDCLLAVFCSIPTQPTDNTYQLLYIYIIPPDDGLQICLKHVEVAAVAQWLMCCAMNRKVAGSIPNGVNGIFHWHNPSDRTVALWSTQPLAEMSTRSISWG